MQEVSLHEDFRRKQEGQGGSDRGFGMVFAAFFAVVALLPLRQHYNLGWGAVRWWALVVAVVFLGVGLFQPAWLRPLNRVWTKLGLLLGRIVSPVVTGLLFFLVVTPIAILFRLLKKDPLRLTSSPVSDTYWIERHPPGPAPETMRNQF